MADKIPIISMWQPWAQWVMVGWKTIETRTHSRLSSLEDKIIGIHAAMKWDNEAFNLAEHFLTPSQIERTSFFPKVGGSLICTVHVSRHRELDGRDSDYALIDCVETKRYGLLLTDLKVIKPPILMKGKQGIWYEELDL